MGDWINMRISELRSEIDREQTKMDMLSLRSKKKISTLRNDIERLKIMKNRMKVISESNLARISEIFRSS